MAKKKKVFMPPPPQKKKGKKIGNDKVGITIWLNPDYKEILQAM